MWGNGSDGTVNFFDAAAVVVVMEAVNTKALHFAAVVVIDVLAATIVAVGVVKTIQNIGIIIQMIMTTSYKYKAFITK